MPRIVDLSLPFESGMAGIPGIPLYERHPVRVEAATLVSEEQRDRLAAEGVPMMAGAPAGSHMNTVMQLNSHVGTHVDAPRHFFADGDSIDRTPLDRLVARQAMVIDLSHLAPGEGVSAEHLERSGVRPAPGEIIVIRTDWTDRAWGRPEFWANTMFLGPDVAEWTMAFSPAAVAMDCFPEKPFWRFSLEPHERGANHRRWLRAGVPMIQLLTGLAAVGSRFTLTALPLRLKGMDGSPARVVGVLED
jgi:kynurenine formamidase